MRRAASGRGVAPAGRAAEEPWGVLWAAGLAVGYFAIWIACGAAVAFGAAGIAVGMDVAKWPMWLLLAVDGVAKVAATGAVFFALRWLRRDAPRGEPAPPRPAIGSGTLAAVAFLPAMVGVAFAQQWAYDAMGREFRGQDLVRRALGEDWGSFAIVAAFAIVLAPLFEEYLFRGLLYGGMRRKFSAAASVFFSSVLFSLWHIEPDAFPVTFVLGLALATLRERTGGLTAPIAMHACYNAVQMAGILTARLGNSGG